MTTTAIRPALPEVYVHPVLPTITGPFVTMEGEQARVVLGLDLIASHRVTGATSSIVLFDADGNDLGAIATANRALTDAEVAAAHATARAMFPAHVTGYHLGGN